MSGELEFLEEIHRKAGQYRLSGHCSNCGKTCEQSFPRGTEKPVRGECPFCGCMSVSYGPIRGWPR